jgi:hypothetical protein
LGCVIKGRRKVRGKVGVCNVGRRKVRGKVGVCDVGRRGSK